MGLKKSLVQICEWKIKIMHMYMDENEDRMAWTASVDFFFLSKKSLAFLVIKKYFIKDI